MSRIPRVWFIVLGAVALIALAYLVGDPRGADRRLAEDGDDDGVTVFYTVSDTGGGPVDLTFTNAGGNVEQIQGAPTTWEKKLTMRRGDFVSVSAQRAGGNGRVRCTITANNDQIEQAESTGEYVIASCSGSIP